jgi:HK97 family phage prohead protease
MDASDLRRFADRARADLPEQRFESLQRIPRRSLEALADGHVARDGLVRATDDEVVGDDNGRTIGGYGGVTNQVTEIHSWEGDFEEEFLSGSFKRTARNQIPKMQFDHGGSAVLGSIPLGKWDTAEEDDHGLRLDGEVFDNWATLPIRDALAAKTISGMSIRFSVVRETWVDRNGKEIKDDRELFDLIFWGEGLDERGPIRRQIKEAKVPEAGPVVWPAYEGTSVDLRSNPTVTIDLGRLNEPAQQRLLARAVYLADTGQVRTTSTTSSSDSQLTERSPDQPPTAPAAPAPVTDPTPGKHSPDGRPKNPTERAALMRAEYRQRFEYLLTLTQSSTTEGGRST